MILLTVSEQSDDSVNYKHTTGKDAEAGCCWYGHNVSDSTSSCLCSLAWTEPTVLICCLHIPFIWPLIYMHTTSVATVSVSKVTWKEERATALHSVHTLFDWLTDLFCVVENTKPLLHFIIYSLTLVIMLIYCYCWRGVWEKEMAGIDFTGTFFSTQSGQTFQIKLGRRGPGGSCQQRELPQGQPAQREVHWGYDQQQFAAFQQAHAHSHQRSEAWEKCLCLICTHEHSWDRNHNGTWPSAHSDFKRIFSIADFYKHKFTLSS